MFVGDYMIKTIFACMIFVLGTAYAAEQKVYSAQDLQKLGEGIFRELNLDGNSASENINLLIAPEDAKRDEVLKEIAKAMNLKNKSEVADIYKLVQQASQLPKTETPEQQSLSETDVMSVSASSQPTPVITSGAIPEPSPMINAPQQEIQPALNPTPRSSGRLDGWIQRNSAQNDASKTPDTP